jgi:hypothetical protein
MAELKTRQNEASVEESLNGVADAARRRDCFTVVAMMREATGAEPKMWGAAIVGFGSYLYRYESGRALDWFLIGFSPRKRDLTLYIVHGIERFPDLTSRLGRHKTRGACLYLRSLADVDLDVLREIIVRSVALLRG